MPNPPTLYTPLPRRLGGNPPPLPLSLPSVLPTPHPPPADALNASIRNRALQLDRNPSRPAPPPPPPPTPAAPRRLPAAKLALPKSQQRHALYLPLHRLWADYARKLLRHERLDNYPERVLRMDLHGADVRVVRARDPGLVGVEGVLVAETANTIVVVTRADRALVIPKNVAVVAVTVADARVEISLPALRFRASERSARKMKKRHLAYL